MLNIFKKLLLILIFNFICSIDCFLRPLGYPSFNFFHLKNSNHQEMDNFIYAEEYYNFLLEYKKYQNKSQVIY